MGIIKHFFRYMRGFFQHYPKFTCFSCGKKFRAVGGNGHVSHPVIPNQDMILIVYFCSRKCFNKHIINRSNLPKDIPLALKY